MGVDQDSEQPSETSPLLDPSKPTKGDTPAGGLVPHGGIDQAAGADLERYDSVDEGRAAQFAGNPDVLKNLKYIIPAVSMGVFLAAADQTIIVSSYARIGNDLKALNLTSWIATAYFLTLTSFQPLYGKLSDIYGRKACLLCAYAIFGLGCMFCGLAQDMNQLIASRIFQGIGGGGMTTLVSIIFSDIIPLKDRGVWQGIINIVYATGAATGAPLGGILADTVGWRWSFLGQVPLCLVAFFTTVFVLRLPVREQKDWKENIRRVDFLGAAVLVTAVFGMIFGLDRGSNTEWSRPISYGPLMASVVLFGVFMFIETRVAFEPFAPGHIIFDRSMFAAYLCNFFSFGGWLAALFYLPLFFQAVDGLSAAAASVRLIPAICCGVSGSLFGGLLMKKTGKFYWLTVIAYSLLTCGVVVITLFTGVVVNNTYGIVIGTMMCSFGNGIGVTSSLIAIVANAPPDDQAVATACSYLFRSLGSVLGISLSTTVINQALRKSLREALGSGKHAERIMDEVRKSLDYINTLRPEVSAVVRDCYGTATKYGFALMIAIVLGSAISALFIREKRLSR